MLPLRCLRAYRAGGSPSKRIRRNPIVCFSCIWSAGIEICRDASLLSMPTTFAMSSFPSGSRDFIQAFRPLDSPDAITRPGFENSRTAHNLTSRCGLQPSRAHARTWPWSTITLASLLGGSAVHCAELWLAGRRNGSLSQTSGPSLSCGCSPKKSGPAWPDATNSA